VKPGLQAEQVVALMRSMQFAYSLQMFEEVLHIFSPVFNTFLAGGYGGITERKHTRIKSPQIVIIHCKKLGVNKSKRTEDSPLYAPVPLTKKPENSHKVPSASTQHSPAPRFPGSPLEPKFNILLIKNKNNNG
jgi:hypothetical protein